MVVFIALFNTSSAFSESIDDFEYQIEFPYTIGKNVDTVQAGDSFQGRICLLYTGEITKPAQIIVDLPKGIMPINMPEGWRFSVNDFGGRLEFIHLFEQGYENWFELLQFQVQQDVLPGTYEIPIQFRLGDQQIEERLHVSIGRGLNQVGKIAINKILLPYDKENGQDQRLDNGTLQLRNGELDYYKNLIVGKGAISTAAATVHPISHMGLEWLNTAHQEKLIVVNVRLLDKVSKKPVKGLVSPESSINDEGHDSGINRLSESHLTVLAVLDGTENQLMDIPIYADETLLKSGEYLIDVSVEENRHIIAQNQLPIKVISNNTHAGLVTAIASVLTIAGLPYILRRGELEKMKSRHLITAGLFGATAFAAINVPGTFLNDFLNIFLGPFSFIVSGMFSGILLYMLISSLVLLIPQFGIVTLMLMVRMLINMLVFGHISPLIILIYGVQAILLEMAFWQLGITKGKWEISTKLILAMAFACGIADTVSTYINLQAFSFLYRLFYADWYIGLCVLISGFIYPVIGAIAGVYLGKELKKVGVD